MKHNCDIFAYDLETGGLNFLTNPICEIGIIRLNWNLEEIERYHRIISPYDKGNWNNPGFSNGQYSDEALKTNKLTMETILKGTNSEIIIKECSDLFLRSKKITGKKPIFAGHNIISFDNPYLENFFTRHKKDLWKFVEKNFCIDTLWLGRLKYKESLDYKLSTCCSNEKISLDPNDAHTAMGDIMANCELVKIFLQNLRGSATESQIMKKRFRETFHF